MRLLGNVFTGAVRMKRDRGWIVLPQRSASMELHWRYAPSLRHAPIHGRANGRLLEIRLTARAIHRSRRRESIAADGARHPTRSSTMLRRTSRIPQDAKHRHAESGDVRYDFHEPHEHPRRRRLPRYLQIVHSSVVSLAHASALLRPPAKVEYASQVVLPVSGLREDVAVTNSAHADGTTGRHLSTCKGRPEGEPAALHVDIVAKVSFTALGNGNGLFYLLGCAMCHVPSAPLRATSTIGRRWHIPVRPAVPRSIQLCVLILIPVFFSWLWTKHYRASRIVRPQ